jgi:hypothetical protein
VSLGWRALQLMHRVVRPHSGTMISLRNLGYLALLGLTVACAEERSGISAEAALLPPIEPSALLVTFQEGNRTWQVLGSDIPPVVYEDGPPARQWATGTSGSIAVTFALADSTGATAVAGAITLPLQRDWRWFVHFFNVTANPAQDCFGCAGTRGFALPEALRTAGRDSLWVVWGGNSVSHQIVY